VQFGGLFRQSALHRSKWAIRGYKTARRVAARAGLDITLKTFYSPIPAVDELPGDIFQRVSPLAGVDLDLDAQLDWLATELAPRMSEFQPPAAHPDPHIYMRDTISYTLLDATVLYAMLRRVRPARVIELGSGASTLVTAQALQANAGEGTTATLDVYDPFPAVINERLPGLTSLHRLRAQDVPIVAFEQLRAGDVLFVDTTHTVKLGSDVNFIVLDVLPRLPVGIVVHLHDIFLPYEYPRQWIEDLALYWSEQYLVQAFLAQNPHWTVRSSTHALLRARQERFAALLPPGVPAREASSFWIERTS
jgi:hypothetical protein